MNVKNNNMWKGLRALLAAIAFVAVLAAAGQVKASTKLDLPLDDAWHEENIESSGTSYADQWKFSVTTPGVVTVRVMSIGMRAGELRLRNEDRTLIYYNNFTSTGSVDNPAVTTSRLRVMPGTFWFDVYTTNLGKGAYKIRASFEAYNPGEPEPNNSFDAAAALKPNYQMNGQICQNDRYDYYKITVPATQDVWVWLYTNQTDAFLRIFNEDFVRVTEKNLSRGKNDAVVQGTWNGTLKAGTYYVQVSGRAGNDTTNFLSTEATGVYRLKWGGSQLPVRVSSLSLNPTAKTIAVGGSAVIETRTAPSDAWNTAVKWTSSNTKIAKVSASGKVKGVKPGKAVITAITKDGSNLTAKCEIIVKPGKVKIVKLTAGKKKISVRWKKQSGVSGYQVQYGTKSSLKSSIMKDIKPSKSKITIKKLKKKRYYVRMRAYKTIGGKNYFGAWSAKKKVKVK